VPPLPPLKNIPCEERCSSFEIIQKSGPIACSSRWFVFTCSITSLLYWYTLILYSPCTSDTPPAESEFYLGLPSELVNETTMGSSPCLVAYRVES
jgi:hypothetical protein